MIAKVVFRPDAALEARAARNWYESQKPGLGSRFADAVEEAIRNIAARATAFPVIHGETRRAVLRRFPYAVYFRLQGNDIVVLAVIHGRRHPREWRSR